MLAPKQYIFSDLFPQTVIKDIDIIELNLTSETLPPAGQTFYIFLNYQQNTRAVVLNLCAAAPWRGLLVLQRAHQLLMIFLIEKCLVSSQMYYDNYYV